MSDDFTKSPRRQRKRKAEAEVDPEFQIAPMIDILLVLLVFFMSITSTEVLQTNQNIHLPVAKEAKEARKMQPAGQVIINVLFTPMNNATTIEVDEQHPTPPELIAMLTAKANLNPQLRVLLRADKEVRYEFMRTLLENIGKSGVGNVTFSVVDKDLPK